MVNVDVETIIQHSQLIVDCLDSEDNSIKLLSLELIGYIVDKSNVQLIVT